MSLREALFGRPLHTKEEQGEQIGTPAGVPAVAAGDTPHSASKRMRTGCIDETEDKKYYQGRRPRS